MASSRIFPLAYVISTYGVTSAPYSRNYSSLATWETDTDINLSSVTTTDQSSSGTTLYVASTAPFAKCVLGRSTIRVSGQTLTINGVTAGDYLTVSTISGTISSGAAVACGFVLECYDDAAPYDDSVTLAGATTSADYFRVIRAADGQRGTETDGVRFYSAETGSNAFVFKIQEGYTGIYDIAVYWSTDSTYQRISFYFINCNYAKAVGCTSIGRGGTNYIQGFWLFDARTVYAINCFAKDSGSGSNASGFLSIKYSTSSTLYCYNCTSTGNKYGILCGTNTTLVAKNCIAQGNTTSNIQGTVTQTTNATSGVTFAADGYHLAAADTVAKDQGTDLSGAAPHNETAFPFDDDIDDNTRSGTWDIGADEYVASGGAASSAAALLLI